MTITQITTRTEKKAGFKTVYRTVEHEQREISEDVYNNITSADTLKFFRRLGGKETVAKGYTSAGYKTVKLISTSPDKQTKVIRTFKFN